MVLMDQEMDVGAYSSLWLKLSMLVCSGVGPTGDVLADSFNIIRAALGWAEDHAIVLCSCTQSWQ